MTMTTETSESMFTPLRTPFGIVRQPTAEECELVGRETSYSEPYEGGHIDYRELGDYVIECWSEIDRAEVLVALRDACEAVGLGDAAVIIPAGIYIEE
jgi:hypothetical protein